MESLIELRQQNKQTNVLSNGDFECQIAPLTLMRNDTIAIKQAFIDNIAKESGKIIIPKDVSSITFKYCMYLQDQDTTIEKAYASRDYFPDTIVEADSPTGKNYVLSSKDPGSGGGNTGKRSARGRGQDTWWGDGLAYLYTGGRRTTVRQAEPAVFTTITTAAPASWACLTLAWAHCTCYDTRSMGSPHGVYRTTYCGSSYRVHL